MAEDLQDVGSGDPLAEIQEVLDSAPGDTQEAEEVSEYEAPIPPDCCQICEGPLTAVELSKGVGVPDSVRAEEGECSKCFYSRLALAQRFKIVEDRLMEWATAGYDAGDLMHRVRESVQDWATVLATGRDARLVGTWADGFLAGLLASRKVPKAKGWTAEGFAMLVEDHNSNMILTGD